MKKSLVLILPGFLLLSLLIVSADDKLVPLKTDLPKPLFVGTPVPVKVPNLEPPRQGKRPDFMIPAGCINLAKGKTVTSSDSQPTTGDLSQITDGIKDGDEGNYVELDRGKQWVQVVAEPVTALKPAISASGDLR